MRRVPLGGDASVVDGVDVLLRRFKGLDVEPVRTAAASIPPSSQGGPIEVTYLVASSEARAEIKAVADFICNGVDDQVELNAGFVAAKAAGLSCKVQMSAGGFYVTDQTIVDASGGWLEGAGEGVSVIWYDPDDWPATTPVVDVVDTHGRASNFTVEEESGC